MRIGIGIVLLLLGAEPTLAQRQLVSTVDFDEALVYYRPRVALAESGDYAVSWEALRKLEDDEEWQVGLRRFSADGEALSSPQYLSQAAYCDNTADSQESGIRNADMGFSDGLLVVSLEQFQRFLDPDSRERQQLSSVRVSVLDEEGAIFRPASDLACEWTETDPVYPDLSAMPRLDVDPHENLLLSTDGHSLRLAPTLNANSALAKSSRIQTVSHQASSNQSNSWVDVATNGWLNASSWQRCSEGLDVEYEVTCDVEVQFFAELHPGKTDNVVRRQVVDSDEMDTALNYRPAVAMNAAGQSVVVWIDYRASELGDIYGQRYDALGEPVGGNFRISKGNGMIDGDDGSRPEVALLDDGRFLVVWTAHHADGMRAWGRYFQSTGEAEADPFLLDPDPTLDSGFPDVASNSNHFAFAWLVEQDGVTSVFANVPGVTHATDQPMPDLDGSLTLKGYPNPFSAETTIEYSVNEEGHVKLVIFDMLGREVKTLIDETQAPGSYFVRLEAGELASGYYVTRLQQGNYQQSRLLVRTD